MIAEEVHRMVHQGYVEVGREGVELLRGGIKAAPSNKQFFVVAIILAKQRSVDGQDAKLVPSRFDDLYGPARRVRGRGSDAAEIGVVPFQEGLKFFLVVD